MRRGGWIAAAALVLMALTGATWWTRGGESGREPSTSKNATPENATTPRVARKPAPQQTPVVDESASTSTVLPPVDLDAVDRDRDLHGVVVRRDGTPVAGAEIVAVSHPWRKTSTLNHVGHDLAVDGPKTRSAADGTFALRLVRGARVTLRVAAEGFPRTFVRERQAGERVRVVLDAGVRLRLTVVDADGRLVPEAKLRLDASDRGNGTSTSQEVVTGADGGVVVDGLPGGSRITVRLLSNGLADPGWVDFTAATSGEFAERLELPKGRSLRGRVVDDATGAPIAKAVVGMNWVRDHAVETDANGRFDLPGWTGKGVEDIDAAAAGYAHASAVVGTRSEFDFRLRRGLVATGRVVDGQGRPVRGALVELVASTHADNVQQTSSGDAVSDDDGRFRVTGLDPKMHHALVVVADGFGRLRRSAPSSGDASPVDLGDVVLPRAGTVAGRVIDADGKPMARVVTTIEGSVPSSPGLEQNWYGNDEELRTDELGRFVFVDLAPGKYFVRADFDGAPASGVSVDVPEGRDVTDVVVRAAASSTIEVRVVDEAGAPVAGQWIMGEWQGDDAGSSETDAHGVARLQAAMDRVTVHAFVDGGTRRFRECATQQWRKGAGALTFVAREGSSIEGTVVDPDGKPVPGATLRFDDGAGESGVTLASGDGVFAQVVPKSAKVTLTLVAVSREKVEDLVGSVRCAAPAKDVVLRCTRVAPDRTLTVKVVTPDGDPAPGVEVSVFHSGGDPLTAKTDAQGAAQFERQPARPRLVVAQPKSAWADSVAQTVVPAGQQIVATLRRAVEIRGVVVGADGAPVKSAVAAWKGDDIVATTSTDGDARYVLRIPADQAGPFRVEAQDAAARGRVGVADDVVAGSGEVRITFAK